MEDIFAKDYTKEEAYDLMKKDPLLQKIVYLVRKWYPRARAYSGMYYSNCLRSVCVTDLDRDECVRLGQLIDPKYTEEVGDDLDYPFYISPVIRSAMDQFVDITDIADGIPASVFEEGVVHLSSTMKEVSIIQDIFDKDYTKEEAYYLLKKDPLLKQIVQTVKRVYPTSKVYSDMYFSSCFRTVYLTNVTREDCNRIGKRIDPNYSPETADEVDYPFYITIAKDNMDCFAINITEIGEVVNA